MKPSDKRFVDIDNDLPSIDMEGYGMKEAWRWIPLKSHDAAFGIRVIPSKISVQDDT